jgi:putative nucleotidyltransferase with HDIG domain
MTDWSHIEQAIITQFGEKMRLTPQPAQWHGEGDVYTHTIMVCEALKAMPEYQELSHIQQQILYAAALLHDIGKIPTTTLADDDWQAPHHAPTGSRMAREWLWKECCLCGQQELARLRETVCLLIRYHSFPPHAIDMEDARLRLHRIASNSLLIPGFSIKMLCILCKADMLGRICADQQQMLDQIALCEELAKEEECYETCYPFPSPYTRRAFLSGRDVWKEQDLFDDAWGEVIMLSGLPGTGKDTWIKQHVPDIPIISLDEIRRANKIPPTAEQGTVANLAREQAKEYLRQHQPFVWNATNITTQMRGSLVSLFETYHAHVRIIFLETDWQTLLVRNHSREAVVPQSAIEHMFDKLVPPEAHEAKDVEWWCV